MNKPYVHGLIAAGIFIVGVLVGQITAISSVSVQTPASTSTLNLLDLAAVAGLTLEFEETSTSSAAQATTTYSGAASGPAITTSNPSVVSNLRASAPSLQGLNGASSSGGDVRSKVQVLGPLNSSFNLFYIIGGIFIIGAVAILWFLKNMTLAIYSGATGLAFIAIGVLINQFPWVWLVGTVLALALLVYWLYTEKKFQFAFSKVVKAVDTLPPKTKAEVKTAIKTEAGPELPIVTDEVNWTKKALI